METQVLSSDAPQTILHAADVLRHGGLVAFPTDTVYGLAASLQFPETIRKLYAVKGRPANKAIALLLASASDLNQVTAGISAAALLLAEAYWPGGLTLVARRHPTLPREATPDETVGVRVPDHPLALDLLRQTGPLAVTSANRSGEPNSLNAADVHETFGGRVAVIIDGGTVPGGIPSTVVDCTVEPPMILRAGPITEEQIRAVLQSPLAE
ncbi:MAG: L-threonylcarbamoyladenylate synthase [Anaerolineales bacterium]